MDKKNILIVLVVLALLAAGYYAYSRSSDDSPAGEDALYGDQESNALNNSNTEPTMTPTPTETQTVQAPETATATVETSAGTFKLALDGKAAPKTVANFIKLANDGFYQGLTFHRIVDGFMIQGGDPKGDGTGGPGYTVAAEIGLKHTKGAIAMARLGDQVNPAKESSGSQFYITLEAQPFLDGQYTVFGYVTEGMDVVEKIGKTPTEPNPFSGEPSVPLETVTINKITITE